MRLQDKINAFWEITKKDLEDRKADLRNKDRESEELEERHQVEIKVYKQKVRAQLDQRCCAVDGSSARQQCLTNAATIPAQQPPNDKQRAAICCFQSREILYISTRCSY